jgi:hypothetical protein
MARVAIFGTGTLGASSEPQAKTRALIELAKLRPRGRFTASPSSNVRG